jgi:RHS repeat-associated protein
VNGNATTYTVNGRNQYTTAADVEYVHDVEGNLASETTTERAVYYSYDALNRLIKVVTPEGTWEYEYDALGHRVAKIHEGVRTEYLIDPVGMPAVVAEHASDGAGVPATFFYHGLGLVGRFTGGAQLALYDFDIRGSVIGLTDTAGHYANRYAYSPFGRQLRSDETIPNEYEYVGLFGVTTERHGLLYMHARYYHPGLGRFCSEDPIGHAGGDLNLYRYVKNSPVDLSDPAGLAEGLTFCTDSKVAVTIWKTKGKWDKPDKCLKEHEKVHRKQCRKKGPYSTPAECNQREVEALTKSLKCAKKHHPWRPDIHKQIEKDLDDAKNGKYYGCPPKPGSGKGKPPKPPAKPSSNSGSLTVGPKDPNAKTASAGAGNANHVPAFATLAYRIDFENDKSATAPAQHVSITDSLSSAIDWATFELTEVGFGDLLIPMSRTARDYTGAVSLSIKERLIKVYVRIGLNQETGVLTALFTSVDPTTGLPPDVLTGFLPPEDGTGRGQGHISYLIRARDDLVSGTEIRNVADIQFDFGETIATNQRDPHDPSKGTDPTLEALVTIDDGPPESHVLPLPAQVAGPSFLVRWSGQDDAGGVGIATYNIYVSDNGGEWALWQEGVADTSASFAGELGHTYAFFSLARDLLGHEEEPPEVADAVTTVVDSVPTELVVYQSEGMVVLSWPVSADSFTLEMSPGLLPTDEWEPVQDTPEVIGDELRVTVEPSEQQRFYRLKE